MYRCSSAVNRAFYLFSFTDPPTTEIYTLSLHDALPISLPSRNRCRVQRTHRFRCRRRRATAGRRSEEHTSELQSRENLVCRLLLEKKKPTPPSTFPTSSDSNEHPLRHRPAFPA